MSEPSGQARLNALSQAFTQRYGKSPRLFSAPGRVNLVGEHTDYNLGFVLPIAIRERTRIAAAPRSDRVIRAYSQALRKERQFSLDDAPARRGKWLDYVEGTARALVARGIPVGGADLMVSSEVPPGAGLSSSAALELAVGMALCSLSGHAMAPKDLALAAHAAENEYVGVRCGVMDQLVGALGKAGHALLIDCRSLDVTEVKIPDLGAKIVCFDTQVRHAHAGSGYNRRRAECQEAVELLQRAGHAIESLRDVGVNDLERALSVLPETLAKRVRHVVRENARTSAAVDALRHSHLPGLGRLMNGSHASLRDDYEVSCPELDYVADAARREDGVLGARMTGGGFGGSVIALVKTEKVSRVAATLRAGFAARFGNEPLIIVTEAGDGVRVESTALA